MKKKIKLKSCPFCGSNRLYFNHTIGYDCVWVLCLNCETSGKMMSSRERAANSWNHRIDSYTEQEIEWEECE